MLKRILGLLGWAGVALVLGAIALSLLLPERQAWVRPLALGGLVCLLLYIMSEWREIGRSFSGRQARLGSLAIGSALVVLAILVGINYIASRQNKRWDLTSNQQYTLSEQSRKFLQSLERPVKVKVFARTEASQEYRDRLAEYEYATKQISVEYIDYLKQPAIAQQYEIQTAGTVVFEYDGRTEKATSNTEQDFTNALIKVVQGKEQKIYFLQGHGEKDPTSSDQRGGYSGASSALTGDNYKVERLVLAQQAAVPDDATIVVIAGPRTDLLPAEIELLKAYEKKGGKLLVMLDPPQGADEPPFSNLMAWLKEWNIEVGANVVVDQSAVGRAMGAGPDVPIAARYPGHPITENFELITAYPLARSVSAVSGATGERTPQVLIETGANSWAETDLEKLMTSGEVQRETDKGDKEGPVSIAAAVSAPAEAPPKPAEPKEAAGAEEGDQPKPETRMAVFGDSDFAGNAALRFQGNRDLFLNVVQWLAQQENLISIRPRQAQDSPITLSQGQLQWIRLLTVILIPGAILLAGVQTWWRRR